MMSKIGRLQKDNQGFTLVELMIVVAIIGILAAIAIPQFAAYRIRGFNSSALSDLRNLSTTQSAFYSDWMAYGITEQAAGVDIEAATGAAAGGSGDGAAVNVADPAVDYPFLTGDDNGGNARATLLGIGNGVTAVASTDTPVAPALAAFYVAVAKHQQGDTFFAVDGDVSAIYQDNSAAQLATGVGYVLVPGDIPGTAAITGADDFTGTAGPSTANWVIK
ncbi:MAG: prepilin-type N-terminal cleavage/methylation domain-containing protein [Proteobacteria bacterium]|nr:prepilin-type N-terminal cleavage/methylation domain-containing protein [Pseudomonadota bacterium]